MTRIIKLIKNMREIKFRTWNETEMFYPENFGMDGGSFGWSTKSYLDIGSIWDSGFDPTCVHKQIMQFVGRQDKHNQDIYENDYVETTDSVVYKVSWNSELCGWTPFVDVDVKPVDVKIIGNRFTFMNDKLQTLATNAFGPSTLSDVNATTHKLKTSFIDCESETIDVVDPVTFAVKTVANPNYDATNNNVTVNVGNVDTLLAELTEISVKSWKSVTLSPTKPDGTFDVLFRYSV